MVRPDIVYSRGRPYFLECNLHSVIGGVVSSSIVGKFFLRSPTAVRLMRDGVGIHARSSLEARRLLLLDVARDMGLRRPPRVALIGWEGDVPPPSSVRLFTEEAEYLSQNGVPTMFIQPQELKIRGGRLAAGSRRFDIALRIFLTREYARAGVSMELFRATERADGTMVLTDDLCSLYTNKIVFAWLHEDAASMRKPDREFIRRHIPWTFVVRGGPLERAGGKRVDLPSYLLRRRREFVLKPLRGSGGSGVVIGRDCPESRWTRHIADAVKKGGFIAQRYVAPDLAAMPFLVDGAIQVVKVPVVLGPFVFGRHDGGCFARFPIDPDRRVVNRAMGAAASVVMAGGRAQ
ncbi:MAG: hypothetical protein KGJ84_00200 [Elusimicrobia bacterium]|nr:hypothetical protein [Elusimicrobiota bacterium]